MINIIEISDVNIHLLKEFIKNKMPNTFRYFLNRNIDCIKNHLLTIVLLNNNIPIGYSHIDYDDNRYWFGICILEEYQSMGFGKKMMEYIFNKQKVKDIKKVYLTVDKININAIKLYEKFNFNIVEEKQSYYLMNKIL